MRTYNRINYLLLIITLTMTTCSATPNRSTQPQITLSPTAYLPVMTNSFPLLTRFGVDGKGSFDRMKAAGVSWLRLNTQLQWSEVEATEGIYDWNKAAQVESRLIDAANNGLNVILLVQNAPGWARKDLDSECGPIREDKFASFGNFLYKVVQRYSQSPYNVKYYQIWNEPDTPLNYDHTVYGCWAEDTDETFGGKYYGMMLAQVYPRIKAADPSAQLVMGSLQMLCDARDPNPQSTCAEAGNRKSASFFKGVLENARNAFDVVMFNSGPSYVSGQNPVWSEMNNWRWKSERGGLVDGKIDYLRGVMASFGIDKPIIHSEAYFLDRPTDLSQFDLFENYKADYLVWAYANGWSRNLKAIVWYTIDGWKGSELLMNGNEETKAYRTLTAMISITQKSQYVSRVDDPAGYTRFIFRATGEDIWILVPTGEVYGTNYSISKPANFKRAVNMYGQEQIITSSTITFNHPLYVVVSH